MSSRDRILKRLREKKYTIETGVLPVMRDVQTFADFPSSGNKLLPYFKKRFVDLKGEIHIVAHNAAAADTIIEIIDSLSNKSCIIQKSPLLQEICSNDERLLQYISEDLSIESSAFAEYEVGITVADVLVARTGSILISSKYGGGRRLSVLPPIHMVIAKEEQIVPSLDQALKNHILDKEYGSYATIITGPSRTSDIEKQLVLGAHGPKRLILILISDRK